MPSATTNAVIGAVALCTLLYAAHVSLDDTKIQQIQLLQKRVDNLQEHIDETNTRVKPIPVVSAVRATEPPASVARKAEESPNGLQACTADYPEEFVSEARYHEMATVILKDIIIPHRSDWSEYHADLCDFIGNHTSGPIRTVEIGTCYGGTTNAIATRFPQATVLAIDPFLGGYTDPETREKSRQESHRSEWHAKMKTDPESFSNAYAQALLMDQRTRHGCRYHVIRNFSSVALPILAQKNSPKFDVAFIDGLHTYTGTQVDTLGLYPLMKPGGLIIWNDYTWVWPGVIQVVDEFVAKHKLPLFKGTKNVPPGLSNVAVLLPG